jgi:hypothetical protein
VAAPTTLVVSEPPPVVVATVAGTGPDDALPVERPPESDALPHAASSTTAARPRHLRTGPA